MFLTLFLESEMFLAFLIIVLNVQRFSCLMFLMVACSCKSIMLERLTLIVKRLKLLAVLGMNCWDADAIVLS
jgi:hypothetical protein